MNMSKKHSGRLSFLSFLLFLTLYFLLSGFIHYSYAKDKDDAEVETSKTDKKEPDADAGDESAITTTTTTATTSSTTTATPEDIVSVKTIDVQSNTGAAKISIPIEVPSGRKGMSPNLTLTYSSGKSNGWIGVGWDIEIGAIQRSAKWGVNYSSNDFVSAHTHKGSGL